jgi:hypothetical protein
VVVAAVTLAVPLGIGTVVTVQQVPSYLGGHLREFSNVSSGDTAALEWSGANLAACSRVLAAPGSAAMFLPLYAHVVLLFPMEPVSVNLSYVRSVAQLTAGTYNSTTRADLLELQVTEVFVTGANSVSYPAFLGAPLLASPDFRLLFGSGDALVLGFEPGLAATGCAA